MAVSRTVTNEKGEKVPRKRTKSSALTEHGEDNTRVKTKRRKLDSLRFSGLLCYPIRESGVAAEPCGEDGRTQSRDKKKILSPARQRSGFDRCFLSLESGGLDCFTRKTITGGRLPCLSLTTTFSIISFM